MRADDETSRKHDLRTLVVRGLGWKLGSQLVIQSAAVASTVVLARLLTPRELGLAAMVLVFSGLAFLLSDLALGAALVQREQLSEADRSTAFWTSAAVGGFLTVLAVALAGPVASIYNEPEARPLLRVLSLSFLFTTLGTTQGALLIRDLRFRALELRTMFATVAGVAVAIVVAALGFGPWALIGQQLASTGISTALLWGSSSWRPQLVFSRQSLRTLIDFGGFVFGSRLLFYLNRNVDNFLVGRYLGAAKLGPYTLAYNIMLIPLNRVASPVQQVFFPALSRIRDPGRVGELWVRTSRLVATVAVPALVGLAIVAPEFVDVVLGSRWHSAVRVLQILCWVGLLQSLMGQNTSVLLAVGQVRTLFRFAGLSSTLTITAYAVGLAWGIVGVAAAYAIVTTVLQPYYAWITGRAVGVSPLRFLAALRGVLEAAAGMGIVVSGARRLLLALDVPPEVRLAMLAALGIGVFVALGAWRSPEVLGELRRVRQRPESPPLPGPDPATPR